MFEDIVIGWDGGPSAAAAVDWAVRHPLGGRILLLTVIDDRAPGAADGSPLQSATAARTAVDAEVARLRAARPGSRIDGEVVVGDTTQVLGRRTGPGRLVVIGTDPVARAGRWTHTVASRVASRAHGPVAVVPLASATATGGVVVVAGVDGTAASIAAARWAAEQARSLGCSLVLAHAWQAAGEPDDPAADGTAPEPPRTGVDADVAGEDEPSRTLPDAHAAVLREVVDEVRSAYPDVPIEPRLLHGAAPLMLHRAAADAALLVLGRHSRWSASTALLGSVAHAILLTSPVPVLVVGTGEEPVAVQEPVLDAGGHRVGV